MKQEKRIVVRGGGDLATGTIHRLWSAGLRVLVLEAEHPAAIRRQVSLCEAVYEGETTVEGLRAVRVASLAEADAVWVQNAVPVLVDPKGSCLAAAKPAVLVDAIIAKKNLGTTRDMAPLTIALGPGFVAGQDVDVVVETKRGHKLGRIIRAGSAAPNSGVPGVIGGYGAERVIHSPLVCSGIAAPSQILWRLARPSPCLKRRKGRPSPLRRRSPASCGGFCGMATRCRRASRWPM